MIRTFLALELPGTTKTELEGLQQGLRGANWTAREHMHVTLLFLGSQHRRALEDLDSALLSLSAPGFDLQFSGVGHFERRDGRAIFAQVSENPDLRRLQSKIANAARGAGLDFEDRRYHPHATVARWRRGDVPQPALSEYEARWNLFKSSPFHVSEFHLFRSDLGRGGPTYTILASYPLK